MAAIEKIYANEEQYHQLYNWVKEHKPEALKYFNDMSEAVWNLMPNQAIALFPENVDMWLLVNCPFDWVKNWIRLVYFIPESDNFNDNVIVPSGETFSGYGGVIGIGYNLEIYGGYDESYFTLRKPVFDSDKVYAPSDLVDLADIAINRWLKFREKWSNAEN